MAIIQTITITTITTATTTTTITTATITTVIATLPTKTPTIMATRITDTAPVIPTRMEITMAEAAAVAPPPLLLLRLHHHHHPAPVLLTTAHPIRHRKTSTMRMQPRTMPTKPKATRKVIVATIICGNEMTTMIITTRPMDTGLPTRISRLGRTVATMTIGMQEVKRYNGMTMPVSPMGMDLTRTNDEDIFPTMMTIDLAVVVALACSVTANVSF